MKKLFGTLGVLIFITVIMALFKLCPPQGPWPLPPWCKSGISIPGFIPPNPFIKGSQGTVAEIKVDDAVTVPTDISKINYPAFYKDIKPAKMTVKNPYCSIDAETVSYPKSYLGAYDLPQVSGAPLPLDIRRAVGIKDIWNNNPNINRCAISGDMMFDSFEKTLPRVKALGAQQIHVTNFVSFKNFQDASLDLNSKVISDDTLRNIAQSARKNGLDVILYLNVAPGNQKVTEIPSNEWLAKFIDNYEPFLLNQAKVAQEVGIKGLMLNHFDYQPTVRGYETVYQEKMLALLKKVREVYSGKVILMIEPFSGVDLNKLDQLLNQVDVFLYTPDTTPLARTQNKAVSVDNIKGYYLGSFADLGRQYGKYKKPFYFRILIQSEKDFLFKGWNEDSFCIKRGDNSCYQKDLTVDFSSQAIAYEALMEALKKSQNKYLNIGAVDTYGYWFTDVMLPDTSQPQIAQSIRNKPAESIVKAWFGK